MTAAPLTYPTSADAEPPLFLPPAGDFCQQRQKSPKTPLETAFQDFLTRVGCDFALTCPTRNRFPGFSRFKGSCLPSFPRCAVARRCPLPRWVPWCSTARVPVDIPSRRTTLSARTHTPCRAGPACPAAGMRFPTARRCGHRPPTKGQAGLPYNERRGRRPAVERSGTNALGVRRPVSAAVPRCEAPSGRGLSAQPTGGEKTVWNLSLRQRFALPPPSQREARGIRIPLRGGTHRSRPTAGYGKPRFSVPSTFFLLIT